LLNKKSENENLIEPFFYLKGLGDKFPRAREEIMTAY